MTYHGPDTRTIDCRSAGEGGPVGGKGTSDASAGPGGFFERELWVIKEIEAAVPELPAIHNEMLEALRPTLMRVHERANYDDPREHAMSWIVNQAVNDLLDVVADCIAGRGRSATRGARSLFEHAVNLAWVLDPNNSGEAERYVDHSVIGRALELDLDPFDETEFAGGERKTVRHAYKKYERRVRRESQAAIARHGEWFKRSWTRRTLRDRAEAVGLGDMYDQYRLLSAVTHGTAGADRWQRREDSSGPPTLRTGPAIAACPVALGLSVSWFIRIIDAIEGETGAATVSRIRKVVEELEEVVPAHREACWWLDGIIWPDGSVRSEVFVALDSLARRQWWLRDVENRKVVRCHPPEMTPEQTRGVEMHLDEFEAQHPVRTETILVKIIDGFALPLPKARWIPEQVAFADLCSPPFDL